MSCCSKSVSSNTIYFHLKKSPPGRNILTQTGPLASENPYRYAGYRYDENTQLYYLMARYYNAENGAFLSIDPYRGDVQDPLSQNGYIYAHNNPVMLFDPDGRMSKHQEVGGGGAGPAGGFGFKVSVPKPVPAPKLTTKGISKVNTWVRMTTKQSTAAAKKLGYEPTNHKAKNGEKIYYNKKTKTYISQDVGSGDGSPPHNGGVWKMAKSLTGINSKRTRMGTYDAYLKRIGD